jgi:PAS domain S-box-containing protein
MIKPADILNARILIVDDLAPNIALLAQMLQAAGYSAVTSTQDPYAVSELHRQNHYDLILLDLQMPGLDGFQVLEGLKAVETDGYPPVLAITAQPEHKLRALKCGARDFISKPFELAEVLLRVRNMLETRRLHRNETVLNHKRLENSQRIAGLGDWDYDFATQKLVWSDEVYRILGIPRQDFPSSSETFYQRVHPDDLAFVREQKRGACEGLHRAEFEHRIIRPSGEVRYVHQIVEMFLDKQGQPLRESGTLRDITAQKAADAALRASEVRFRALSEFAPLGIFECDAGGRVIYNNPALTALTGRPVETALGRGWAQNIHPDDRLAVTAGWEQAVALGRDWDQEQRVVRPDGSVRWVHTLAAPGKDAQGRTTGFIGTVEDITDRRQAEIVIRESEERYRKMVMLSPDAHFVHVDERITFVNEAFCQLMGGSVPAEFVGRLALDVVHPDCQEIVHEVRRKLSNNEPVTPFEVKFVRLDGSAVDVQAACVAFDFRGHKEVQVSARDITANKAAVVALRESEERFKFVARAVSDVVWDWNLVANTLWWNDGFLTTFGFAAGEINSSVEFWKERIHAEDRPRVVESLQRAVAGAVETWSAEYRFQRKDGTYAFVQDRGYILRNAAGRGIRMVGGMRDLTEQKKMEAQYLRAQRMESIGTLAGGIAHDLNNILAPIMMSVELLKLEAGDDPRRRKILDAIHVSSRRGADLVRQVLSFARGLDGERSVLRLGPVVADLEAIISETFPRAIRIVTQVPADLWPVMGDPTQLHQVLLNLTVNARDAMPHGGSLTVTAANVIIDDLYAGTSREAKAGSHVLLQVSDTGLGIPPEVRERIFEPFFTTKEFGKGSGIGLTTVHTIIKSHNGFMKVESEVGHGTTFKIYLPAEPDLPAAEAAPAVPAKVDRGRNELVLVVDDEVSIRDITRQTLETYGYRVITASDGAEAVALYAQQAQDVAVVMTDMMMPFMDGTATIQVLTRINPSVKIIAASGLAVAENVAKAINAGAQDFLPKPFTAHTLRQLVRKVIDRPVLHPTR